MSLRRRVTRNKAREEFKSGHSTTARMLAKLMPRQGNESYAVTVRRWAKHLRTLTNKPIPMPPQVVATDPEAGAATLEQPPPAE